MSEIKYRPRADRKPLTKKHITELRKKLRDDNYIQNACEVMSNRIARQIIKGGSYAKK